MSLVHAVRDEVRYDPYRIDLSARGMRASTCLEQGFGWCVPKAVLMAAVARAAGIPARLGFADVRNHMSTEKLRRTMGTDVFVWHGCTELWIDGAWRKATPAFNLSLCEKFGLLPLDFDGVNDSLYHPFDRVGAATHGIRARTRQLRRPAAAGDRRQLPHHLSAAGGRHRPGG